VLITGGGAESIMLLLPPGVLRAASALLDASSKVVATKIENVDFIGTASILPVNRDARRGGLGVQDCPPLRLLVAGVPAVAEP
jgi:hypothetical protein